MSSKLGRAVGAIIRSIVLIIVLSVIASAALTLAMGGLGTGDGVAIETPDPLPDWPFVWEVPIDGQPDIDTEPQSAPADAEDHGDPVATDPGTTQVTTGDTTVTSDAIEQAVHERVNEIRTDHELSPVRHDDEIASIARTHSHDMGERDYFSHISPEGEGPGDRMDELFPAECSAVGENLAMVGIVGVGDATDLADRIVEGWMNSEAHRENLLTPRWESEGIGVYLTDNTAFASQNFCDDR